MALSSAACGLLRQSRQSFEGLQKSKEVYLWYILFRSNKLDNGLNIVYKVYHEYTKTR